MLEGNPPAAEPETKVERLVREADRAVQRGGGDHGQDPEDGAAGQERASGPLDGVDVGEGEGGEPDACEDGALEESALAGDAQ